MGATSLQRWSETWLARTVNACGICLSVTAHGLFLSHSLLQTSSSPAAANAQDDITTTADEKRRPPPNHREL